jgi:DeoR/GlpR family transcriptional regulator of sugar metabolism
LAAALDCSEMTVRRDFEALERSGGLRRVHGGAASVFLSAEETLTAFAPLSPGDPMRR